MADHTPGPWEYDRSETAMQEFRGYSVTYPSDAYGPGTRLVLISPECLENEADARLIAAAPDLLEALELLLNQASTLPMEDRQIGAAAIAKARNGEA